MKKETWTEHHNRMMKMTPEQIQKLHGKKCMCWDCCYRPEYS